MMGMRLFSLSRVAERLIGEEARKICDCPRPETPTRSDPFDTIPKRNSIPNPPSAAADGRPGTQRCNSTSRMACRWMQMWLIVNVNSHN
jgi:hypothetical protein